MPVSVQLPTILRSYTNGVAEVDAGGETVRAVFAELDRRYKLGNRLVTEDGSLHRFVNVYLDDEDIRYLDGLDTKVGDGATIAILPAVAGG